ncbi:hypothetical protein N7488_007935 [Penicillium malachiteum]|nr:hypothetical protein N7488_007935 [Penicillium malachiteum]
MPRASGSSQPARTSSQNIQEDHSILVNNAGMRAVMPLPDTSLDEAKKLYDTNVWAILAMTQE